MPMQTAPLCACHGVEMLWHKDSRRQAGGTWRCHIRVREEGRRYDSSVKGRARKHTQDDRRKERSRRVVQAELERRGDHCVWPGCQETDDLHWHHRDPATKSARVSKLVVTRASVACIRAELAKCDPLCEEHHKAAHDELRAVAA